MLKGVIDAVGGVRPNLAKLSSGDGEIDERDDVGYPSGVCSKRLVEVVVVVPQRPVELGKL